MTDIALDLVGNNDLTLELLAIMVQRAGGCVYLKREDTLPPFNLETAIMSDGSLRLTLKLEEIGHV